MSHTEYAIIYWQQDSTYPKMYTDQDGHVITYKHLNTADNVAYHLEKEHKWDCRVISLDGVKA